jgi:acetylornithine deacetylase
VLDVVQLTQELCSIPSVTLAEADVIDYVSTRLKKLGAKVMHQRVGDPAGRGNILAVTGDKPPELLFTTHLDTVPPFIPPRIEGDTLWGRGVIDAKGAASAMITAWERLVTSGETRVALMFVVGEETDSDGAKAAASGFAPNVKYFIDGEPTDGVLVSAMKGVMAFELEAKGKAAHSAYPEAGHNALHQIIADIARLQGEPWPNDPQVGQTTLNVGVLHGGVAPNVLAPQAEAVCVMRTTIDADVLEQRIRALLSPTTAMRVRTKSSPQFLVTLPDEPTKVVAFGSDVPHLTGIGRPVLVGPGSILDAHTSHEHVALKDLHSAVELYEKLAIRLLGTP